MTKKTDKYGGYDRINTVVRPTAQIETKFAENSQFLDEMNAKVEDILSKNEVPELLKRFIYIQSRSGTRVSEILNIQYTDIISPTIIRIKGLKRSNDRLIHIDRYSDYFIFCKVNMINPFANFNRYFIYREYRKLGFVVSFVNSNKKAVTHSFRYKYIKNLKDNDVNLDLIQKEIGHKTIKTTERYEQKSRRISGN